MKTRYKYKEPRKNYLLSLVLLAGIFLLNYSGVVRVFEGNTSNQDIFHIILALLFVPLPPLLSIFYSKKVYIETDEEGITFSGIFRQIRFLWGKIDLVRRVDGRVRVDGPEGEFFFGLSILPLNSDKSSDCRKPAFRDCELLMEIREKAPNAKFEGFPEGTFDEIDTDIQKGGAIR